MRIRRDQVGWDREGSGDQGNLVGGVSHGIPWHVRPVTRTVLLGWLAGWLAGVEGGCG